ncbi:MAG: hypothetical protein ABIN94_21555 [Ferruginibacter sp.]
MLLVVYTFIISCKLVIAAIIWIENSIKAMQPAKLACLPVLLKRNLFILFAATFPMNDGIKNQVEHTQCETANNFNKKC